MHSRYTMAVIYFSSSNIKILRRLSNVVFMAYASPCVCVSMFPYLISHLYERVPLLFLLAVIFTETHLYE